MTRQLRAAPVTLLCAPALGLIVWWAADDGGYGVTLWAPGLMVAVALLAAAVVALPNAWRDVPRPVLVAAALLWGYALWSYASIAWAGDQGAAWTGATRTLLYAVVFSLFALWPQRPRAALALLATWLVGVAGIALVLLARISAGEDLGRFFADGVLLSPAGYHNAAAATFAMALVPAVILTAERALHPALRVACAGAGVLCADTALLAFSRGSLIALAVCLLVLFAVVPGRLRNAAALLVIGAGAAVAVPSLLDLGDALDAGRGADPDAAVSLVFFGAVVAGAAVVALASWETQRPPAPHVQERVARGAAVIAVVVACAGAVAALAVGIPRIDDAWDSFKSGYREDASTQAPSSRLTSGLGSARYDFYRVSLREFGDHPVAGIGADNFKAQYLRRGDSDETPRYPHSIELRALTQTGVIGFWLLFGAFASALVAVWWGLRAADAVTRAVAAAASAAFVYWLVHGSADWFFEYAGLGAAAFALLGLACALAPRPDPPRAPARRARRPAEIAAVVVAALLCALPALSLWSAQRDVDAAVAAFDTAPGKAYARLDRAARLNPFAAEPRTLEGSIALRHDDLARADAAFGAARERNASDQYATLEQGAVASARGDLARARRLLARAVKLAPRDPIAREALAIVHDGDAVDLDALNARIRARDARLVTR